MQPNSKLGDFRKPEITVSLIYSCASAEWLGAIINLSLQRTTSLARKERGTGPAPLPTITLRPFGVQAGIFAICAVALAICRKEVFF